MKQSELGIRMATVGLCGLRFWARFPTETYRCPALLQMAFSFSEKPISGDRPNDSSSSTTNLPDPYFGKSGSSEKKEKGNTTIPAMVLRSEMEQLSVNKKQEEEILSVNSSIENQNKEVEKLMDLCLNQREEIKSLKSSFLDVMNSQLQELVEKQCSELKEAKQVIPSLQQQVSSLTGQLQSLAKDLAEVKADLFYGSSPRTQPPHGREDALNSLHNIGNQGGQENKKGKRGWKKPSWPRPSWPRPSWPRPSWPRPSLRWKHGKQ